MVVHATWRQRIDDYDDLTGGTCDIRCIHLAYHSTVRSLTKKQTNKFSYRSFVFSVALTTHTHTLIHSQAHTRRTRPFLFVDSTLCAIHSVRLCLMLFAYSTWCTVYTNTLCTRPAKGAPPANKQTIPVPTVNIGERVSE